jgi:hypothetical protein
MHLEASAATQFFRVRVKIQREPEQDLGFGANFEETTWLQKGK